MPEANKAGGGPKGDRAHFPGVTVSTAPSAELSVAKNCQCMGQQRLCPPTREEGKGKRDGKHLGSSISYSTPQSVARSAETRKAHSKFYMYSLSSFPSKADVFIVKCTLR